MDLITIIAGAIVSVGTFMAGIFLERRKSRAEARGKELSNVDQEITIYKRMMDDQQTHMTELRRMNADLMNTVQPLRERVTHLEEVVRRLELENANLKKKR